MPDATKRANVILVITSDVVMQESVRLIVEAAGCHALGVPSIALAQERLRSVEPVLILIDPLWQADAVSQLGPEPPVVEIPVRTSSSGVRRVAKKGAAATRWLQALISERCSAGKAPSTASRR
jgi:hypothetical protein